MLQQLNNTIRIFRHALRLAWRRPVVLVPLLLLWLLYVPLVAFLAFHADLTAIPPMIASIGLFLVPIALHTGLALACAILVRSTGEMSAKRPATLISQCRDILKEHKFKLLTLGVIAGMINMLLIMFQAIHSPESSGIPDTLRAYSLENLARILLNISSDELLSAAALKYAVIKKAVRLTIFLAVAGFILTRKKTEHLFDRAFYVIDRNMIIAVSGLILTGVAAYILSLPAAYIVTGHDQGIYTLDNTAWGMLMGYAGILWIFMLYLEQSFCLILFRWHHAREDRGPKAELKDTPMPDVGGT